MNIITSYITQCQQHWIEAFHYRYKENRSALLAWFLLTTGGKHLHALQIPSSVCHSLPGVGLPLLIQYHVPTNKVCSELLVHKIKVSQNTTVHFNSTQFVMSTTTDTYGIWRMIFFFKLLNAVKFQFHYQNIVSHN
jgi:hypothetical protein